MNLKGFFSEEPKFDGKNVKLIEWNIFIPVQKYFLLLIWLLLWATTIQINTCCKLALGSLDVQDKFQPDPVENKQFYEA